MIKNLSLIFLLIFAAAQIYPQKEQLIKQKLEQEGIKNQADIQKALKEKNMTEEDARTLAKQYGVNYDQFIQMYIMGGREILLPQAQLLTPIDNTVQQEEQAESEHKSEDSIIVAQSREKKGSEYFGYNLFEKIPSAFEPAAVGPVDPGYLIGPGDVLRLYIWGAVELQYELTVDNQGTVFIPTAGQMFVSGVSYSELKNKMTLYLSRFYEGLTG